MGALDDPLDNELATMMGMGLDVLKPLLSLPIAEANKKLAELQKDLPSRYKQAAFRIHPDRNPDDPMATEKLQRLNELRTWLGQLRAEPIQPVYDPAAMVVYRYSYTTGYTGSVTFYYSGSTV